MNIVRATRVPGRLEPDLDVFTPLLRDDWLRLLPDALPSRPSHWLGYVWADGGSDDTCHLLSVVWEWPGYPNASTSLPRALDIDYLRAWQQGAAGVA